VSSFIKRQCVVLIAALMFLTFTFVRTRLGHDTRDPRTLAADISKQGLQQGFGGLLMAAVGVGLARHSYDALAWYGAEYPFEIVLTTCFTRVLRFASERLARRMHDPATRPPGDVWLPMLHMGTYGPSEREFKLRWYAVQMLQAVLLIGVPARLLSVGIILMSMLLPSAISPVHGLASAWFHSGLNCHVRTAFTLYAIPLFGDVVQFVLIDFIQKASAHSRAFHRSLLHESSSAGSSMSISPPASPC